jgi:hypothetical protein
MTSINASELTMREASRLFERQMRAREAEKLAAAQMAMAAQLEVLRTCSDRTRISFQKILGTAGKGYDYVGIKVNDLWYLSGGDVALDHTTMVVWLLSGVPVTRIDVLVGSTKWLVTG